MRHGTKVKGSLCYLAPELLKSEYKNGFHAPFVAESNIQLGVEFKEKIDISINSTTMIIGEITQIYIPENCLLDDGFIDLEKAYDRIDRSTLWEDMAG